MVPGGAALFQRVYTRLGCEGRPPRFRVEFYPYSSLVLTIRRREDAVWVRLSDLLQRAPLSVLEGAAALLLSRVYRRRAPAVLTAPYLEYARSDRTRARINHMRRQRVRPGAAGPQGRHFNLEKLFEELNARYFEGKLQSPHIGWSNRRLAAAVRLLRSRPKSHPPEPAHGPPGCAAICSGICVVSRNAARQTPHSAFRVQSGVAFPRISRGREAFCGICASAACTRPLGTLRISQRYDPYFFFRSTSLRSCRFSCGFYRHPRHADRGQDTANRKRSPAFSDPFSLAPRPDSERELRTPAWR